MNRKAVRRLVVKVGTSTVSSGHGRLDRQRMGRLADELSTIQASGVEVVLVSSGSIAAGMSALGWARRPTELAAKQAAAAVGQPLLMETYRQLFAKHRVLVAQILLTREDFENRKRCLNAKATLDTLLKDRVVPIINENDTVAVEEIRVGDNDTLAARVAVTVKADVLVLLTDVEGLMTKHPREGQGELISRVDKITSRIEAIAQAVPGTEGGTGGMMTKIRAAKLATSRGVAMVIASGRTPGALLHLLDGKSVGTYFKPR